MPIFSRRRLQSMVDELAPFLDESKARDVVQRIENKRVEQSLPAEMELALCWAVSKFGPVEIEPKSWPGGKRPDILTGCLFDGAIAAIDVTALDDNSISGEAEMLGIARQFEAIANKFRKGLGRQLFFQFGSIREGGVRTRGAPVDYRVTKPVATQFQNWLRTGPIDQDRLQINENRLRIEIQFASLSLTEQFRIHSTMPPQANDVERNPLYASLSSKLPQLKHAPAGCLKMIFVADAGSRLLRNMGQSGESQQQFSRTRIIQHFVAKNSRHVDAIVTFSPRPEQQVFWQPNRKLIWRATIVSDHQIVRDQKSRLDALAQSLPVPQYESYQAKSLHRQGSFKPENLEPYLGGHMSSDGFDATFRISARMVLDLMSGKLDPKRFGDMIGQRNGNPNPFADFVRRGMILRDVQSEPGGVDEDDDYLVLKFSFDPAAGPLRTPRRKK